MTATDGVARDKRHWRPGALCIICGEKIHQFQRFNYDHLIPMSRGGARGRSNKYLAHVVCNMVKGNQWPFWLRNSEERMKARSRVSPDVWSALLRAWRGHPD